MKEYLLANPQVVATLIVGFFTLVITWWFNRTNYRLNHQKMEKELFSEFNKRYDILNDSLTMLDSITSVEQLKETPSFIDKKSMHNLLIDYFNLCSEQYYWYKKNRIKRLLWKSWHSGMMHYYTKYPIFRELWENEIKGDGYKSYYLKEGKNFFKETY